MYSTNETLIDVLSVCSCICRHSGRSTLLHLHFTHSDSKCKQVTQVNELI